MAVLAWVLLLALVTLLLWALYRTPPQLTLTRELPHSGFVGSRLPLSIHVRLSSVLPMRVIIEDPAPRSVVPDTNPRLQFLLLGDVNRSLSVPLNLNRRGVFDWPGATLRWADPLGLFWRSATVSPATTLEVYPGTHGLTLPDLLRPLLSEGSLTRSVGLDDPISLRGAREYVYGDAPGRVHWRLSARTGQLMVREVERMAASSLTVYLDLQTSQEVYLESAVRLAASLLREASEMNLPIAVATSAGVTPTGTGEASLHAALLALAKAQLTTEPPYIPPTRSGGNLIIITARAALPLIKQAMLARANASRVSILALPEGFYLEPGENPRRQWTGLPETVRELEGMAGTLAGAGILVYVLRGNQSVLKIATPAH